MRISLFTLLLITAGLFVSASAMSGERVVYVETAPVAGLAVWGGSQGQYGWSGSISLGSAPVYAVPAYAPAPWPVQVLGPYRGNAPRHHQRHRHKHHGKHAGRYQHARGQPVQYIPVYRH